MKAAGIMAAAQGSPAAAAMSEKPKPEEDTQTWESLSAGALQRLPIVALVALAAQWGGDLSDMPEDLVAGCSSLQMKALARGFKEHREALSRQAASVPLTSRSATMRLDFNSTPRRGGTPTPAGSPQTAPPLLGFPSNTAKNDFNVSLPVCDHGERMRICCAFWVVDVLHLLISPCLLPQKVVRTLAAEVGMDKRFTVSYQPPDLKNILKAKIRERFPVKEFPYVTENAVS